MPAEITDCPVNDLIKDLLGTPAGLDRRATPHVGRLLVHCRRPCPDWREATGCQLHDRTEWIDILIRPGRDCARGCLLDLPPLDVVRGAG